MKKTRYLLLGLLGITASGCIFVSSTKEYKTPPPQVVYVPVPAGATTQTAVSADLQARLDAVGSIVSFSERDSALAGIARMAADCGDVAMTRQALAGMTSFSARDNACEAAALTLAQRGHRAEAIELARTMTSFNHRDKTLAQLARQ